MQLANQFASHIARTGNKNVYLFITGFKKFFMQNVYRFRTSLCIITAEIFLSDEPCAMALTFTPFFPSASKHFSADARMAFHVITYQVPRSKDLFQRSMALHAASLFHLQMPGQLTCFAFSAFTASIPTQIECSEEPCVIRITLMEASGK